MTSITTANWRKPSSSSSPVTRSRYIDSNCGNTNSSGENVQKQKQQQQRWDSPGVLPAKKSSPGAVPVERHIKRNRLASPLSADPRYLSSVLLARGDAEE